MILQVFFHNSLVDHTKAYLMQKSLVLLSFLIIWTFKALASEPITFDGVRYQVTLKNTLQLKTTNEVHKWHNEKTFTKLSYSERNVYSADERFDAHIAKPVRVTSF